MSTFYDWIFGNPNEWEKPILITSKKRSTVRDLYKRVEYYRAVLRKHGSIQGKKIGALVPSLIDYTAIMVAVNKEEGIFIPLSWQLRTEDLMNILELTDPHMVFSVGSLHGFDFGQAIKKWALESGKGTILFFQVESDGCFDQAEVIPGAKRERETERADLIAGTSGSTGVPKGVKLSVDSIENWTKGNMDALQMKAGDCLFSSIPAAAPYGIFWLLAAFRFRFELLASEIFDLPNIMELLKNNPCNKVISTPSLFKAIFRFAKSAAPAVIDRFERCGFAGEMVSEDFVLLLSDMKNSPLVSLYGLSEQGILMYSNDLRNEQTEWTISPGVQYRIADLNSDGMGELVTYTPGRFLGYYRRSDLTREVCTEEGWFHTGDLVKLKENQKVEMVGRKKDLIKKAGQQVAPGEVEQVLLQHPEVKQAAVVGVPHNVYGEQVVAFVVAEEALDIQDLYSFAAERIARYKVPDKIQLIDRMPMSQGKLDKVTLKKSVL